MGKIVKILLAEDDTNLGNLLRDYLMAKGYVAHLQPNGDAAYTAFKNNFYHLCLLDIMMPKKDGFTLAKEIRSKRPDMPIIFLSAKNLKDDVIEGFKIGADDYLTKPFSMEELICRIEAVLKRAVVREIELEKTVFEIGKYSFDSLKQELIVNNETIKLTGKESDLLKLLINNKNNLINRQRAANEIWGKEKLLSDRSLDVYIAKLRKYLKKDPKINIVSIHGVGYKLII